METFLFKQSDENSEYSLNSITSLAMIRLEYLIIIAVNIFWSVSVELKSIETFAVMLTYSEHQSDYYHNTSHSFERLDLKLIENFGKKFKVHFEYIVTNETLNEVFSSEERFSRFSQSAEFL